MVMRLQYAVLSFLKSYFARKYPSHIKRCFSVSNMCEVWIAVAIGTEFRFTNQTFEDGDIAPPTSPASYAPTKTLNHIHISFAWILFLITLHHTKTLASSILGYFGQF